MGSYVGIDLHRRRSVVVVLNEAGNRVSWSRIDNTPANLAAEVVAAGGSCRRSPKAALSAQADSLRLPEQKARHSMSPRQLGRRGGDGSDVGVVLGGRCDRRVRGNTAFG